MLNPCIYLHQWLIRTDTCLSLENTVFWTKIIRKVHLDLATSLRYFQKRFIKRSRKSGEWDVSQTITRNSQKTPPDKFEEVFSIYLFGELRHLCEFCEHNLFCLAVPGRSPCTQHCWKVVLVFSAPKLPAELMPWLWWRLCSHRHPGADRSGRCHGRWVLEVWPQWWLGVLHGILCQ